MVIEVLQHIAGVVAATDFASLVFTTAFFIGVAIATWFMYRLISERDIFKTELPGRLGKFVHTTKYVLLLPAWTVFWFLVYAILLQVLSQNPVADVLLGSVMIVAGIRVAAYLRNEFAGEIASILPLTILAGIMLNPSYIGAQTIVDSAVALTANVDMLIQYISFLIIVEWALRLTLWALVRTRAYLNGRYLLPFGHISIPTGVAGAAAGVTALNVQKSRV